MRVIFCSVFESIVNPGFTSLKAWPIWSFFSTLLTCSMNLLNEITCFKLWGLKKKWLNEDWMKGSSRNKNSFDWWSLLEFFDVLSCIIVSYFTTNLEIYNSSSNASSNNSLNRILPCFRGWWVLMLWNVKASSSFFPAVIIIITESHY